LKIENENNTIETRASVLPHWGAGGFKKLMIMKKFLLLSFAFLPFVGVCQNNNGANTPPYAASTQTWTFGKQIWSDAIRIPACNKVSFTDSKDTSDCRSYTGGLEIWYYYNWAYVHANADTLCPSPWRVPTENDLELLVKIAKQNSLIDAWGLPGYAIGNSTGAEGELANLGGEGKLGYQWSATSLGNMYAYYLGYSSGGLYVGNTSKGYRFQVRCVR
jgi:uncharacterized protein (TIGR02145 family)